jgi:hypothetical protein
VVVEAKEPPQVPPVTTLAYVVASVMLARFQVAPVAGPVRLLHAACPSSTFLLVLTPR